MKFALSSFNKQFVHFFELSLLVADDAFDLSGLEVQLAVCDLAPSTDLMVAWKFEWGLKRVVLIKQGVALCALFVCHIIEYN